MSNLRIDANVMSYRPKTNNQMQKSLFEIL